MVKGRLTFKILCCQEDGTQVVVLDEMAYLWCDFCAIPPHDQHLADRPT